MTMKLRATLTGLAVGLSLTAAGLVFPAGAARAEVPFVEQPGIWVGTGTFREKPEAPLQRGRCRFKVSPLPDGQGSEIAGKCASPSGAARIALRIERRGKGLVAAGLSVSLREGVMQYLGTEAKDGITLRARADDGTPADSKLDLRWLDGKRVSLSDARVAPDGSEIKMLEMTFTRRKGS